MISDPQVNNNNAHSSQHDDTQDNDSESNEESDSSGSSQESDQSDDPDFDDDSVMGLFMGAFRRRGVTTFRCESFTFNDKIGELPLINTNEDYVNQVIQGGLRVFFPKDFCCSRYP